MVLPHGLASLLHALLVSVAGLCLLFAAFACRNRSTRTRNFPDVSWQPMFISWGALCAVLVASSIMWRGHLDTTEPDVNYLLLDACKLAWSALIHSVPFIVPVVACTSIIMCTLVVQAIRSERNEPVTGTARPVSVLGKRRQARVISWTIQLLLLLFAGFSVLSDLGVDTTGVLQIVTVLAAGLAWAAQDILSNMLASSMLSTSTGITCQSKIRLGTGSTRDTDSMTVHTIGQMFTCLDVTGGTLYYPNSRLLQQGFVLLD